MPSVLWHLWLGVRKSIRPVITEWWGVVVVICLEWGADCLHTVQLMPLLSKTPSSLASCKSRLVLPFWYQLTQVVLEKRPSDGCSNSSSSCCCIVLLTSCPRGPVYKLSYNNAKVTVDLQRTSNLQNMLQWMEGFSYVRFMCKIVISSETVHVSEMCRLGCKTLLVSAQSEVMFVN